MGHVDKDWRDKDDADLTSEDLDDMLAAGKPVSVTGPTAAGRAGAESSKRSRPVRHPAKEDPALLASQAVQRG